MSYPMNLTLTQVLVICAIATFVYRYKLMKTGDYHASPLIHAFGILGPVGAFMEPRLAPIVLVAMATFHLADVGIPMMTKA